MPDIGLNAKAAKEVSEEKPSLSYAAKKVSHAPIMVNLTELLYTNTTPLQYLTERIVITCRIFLATT